MKISRGEKTFQIFNYVFLAVLALLTLYPFWEVVRVSFSNPFEASRLSFTLLPRKFSLEAYQHVFNNQYLWIGYKNTIYRVILSLSLSMTIMTMLSYALSKKYFPNRTFWTMIIVFTMFFHGGLIPNYLLIKNLGLYNTYWALVLPGLVGTFSMFIMRNYFMSLPEELEESAKIDGAGAFRIFVQIILPLAKPILMTVMLWELVGAWNAWFDCLIYISDGKKYVLQAILRKIIIEASPQFNDIGDAASAMEKEAAAVSVEVVKCATIIVSTLPVMLFYPFVQKYFIKGVMVGSLKG